MTNGSFQVNSHTKNRHINFFKNCTYNVHLHTSKLNNLDPMWQIGHFRWTRTPKIVTLNYFIGKSTYIHKIDLINLDPIWLVNSHNKNRHFKFCHKLYNVHLLKRKLDNLDPLWQMGHSRWTCTQKIVYDK